MRTSYGSAPEFLLPHMQHSEYLEQLQSQGTGQHGLGGSLGTELESEKTKRLKRRGSQGTSAVRELDQRLLSFI